MNNPEYIIVDEIGAVVEAARVALGLPALNYQYGYARELGETLNQWAQNTTDEPLKFPLVWLEQPFNVTSGKTAAWYGTIDVLRLFVMTGTEKTAKASRRMETTFKPVILPIVRELLTQIDLSVAFHTQSAELIKRTIQDRYYWGEAQQSVIGDAVDCTIVTIKDLDVANNPNCTPT